MADTNASAQATQGQAQAPDLEQLKAQIQEALAKGDFKAIAKLSSEIAKAQRQAEEAEREAKQKALAELTQKVMKAIKKAIQPFIDDGSLAQADGVWFAWDFGDTSESCRLVKSAPRKSGGGGGRGQRFDISSEELLAKYGDQIDEATGKTYKDLWAESTDGNHRYKVRCKLLKAAGLR
jgi:hypothetical protein